MDDQTYQANVSSLISYYLHTTSGECFDNNKVGLYLVDNTIEIRYWEFEAPLPTEETLRSYNVEEANNVSRLCNLSLQLGSTKLLQFTTDEIASLCHVEEGMYLWDTTLKKVKVYDGVGWLNLN
jgi:hypothetical protein